MDRADLTLSAGPNDVFPEVRAALAAPVLYHYDPVFKEHFRNTEELMARIFRTTRHEIILMQGEAVLGLEAAARALVTTGTPVLNLVSGVFGKGFGYWLTGLGAELHEITVAYNESVSAEAVRTYLDAHPQIKVLSVVHCETPSGTLNPVREIGQLCRERGVVTVVDVVASLGGIPLESEAWQLDLLVAGPQKCLGGPPGMSLMAVSPEAWALIDANPTAPKGSFLSLLDWRETWHKGGRFPFTPSVSDLNGVAAAAELMLAEGLDVVQARHERVARACRAGVRGMGLRVWAASDDIAAASVTSIAVPDGLTDIAVRDHVRARYGIQLSAGQNAGNIIRIGHMGNTARPMWMVAGLAAVGRTMTDLGVSVGVGAGLEAAMASLSLPVTTLAPFELHRARSVAEATHLLADLGEDAVIYAGGTELLLLMKLGFAAYGHLIDIKPIGELHGIGVTDGTLHIGAAVTHREVERSPLVLDGWPELARLEGHLANIRVRSIGTLGGNLSFADPHSDPATFLLAADARVIIGGDDGRRSVPIAEFTTGPYETALRAGEVLVAVEVPAIGDGAAMVHHRFAFHERPAATVSCLVRVRDGHITEARVAVGSVGVRPVRVTDAGRHAVGQPSAAPDAAALALCGRIAADASEPVTDSNGSDEYKHHLVGVMVARCIREAAMRAAAPGIAAA